MDQRLVLDRAEQAALRTAADSRDSEAPFLQKLLQEVGQRVSAATRTPAAMLRSILADGESTEEAWQVVARPCERPKVALRAGDWMLRATPGSGDIGHIAVLASGQLLPGSALVWHGLTSESSRAGEYAIVIESGKFPHTRSDRFARRCLDANGRVPPHTIFLRPMYPTDAEEAMSYAPPVPPPAPVAPVRIVRQDGIDVYEGNSDLPSWDQIRDAGITFFIHKVSETRRSGHDVPDALFPDRYREARAHGFIRGSFHYYRHADGKTGADHAMQVVSAVQRLGPGDLAPSLDFEGDAVTFGQQEPATAAAWRTELESFLDFVETRLGRTPLIYTRAGAWGHISGKHDHRAADFAHFGDYPLWVVHYEPRFISVPDPPHPDINVDLDTPANATPKVYWAAALLAGERRYTNRQTNNPPAAEIPGPWRTWAIWQYSNFTPSSLVQHHGFTHRSAYAVDFNVTHGGIHALRGMADLDHTAPHRVGNLQCIAYTETDGHIHLLENLGGSWQDLDVFSDAGGHLPLAAGDPTACGIGNEQVIVYRSVDGHVYAVGRTLAGAQNNWRAVDITGTRFAAFDDPQLLVLNNALHVVYWDEFGAQVHASRVGAAWRAESFVDPGGALEALFGPAYNNPVIPSSASGSAAIYAFGNAVHLVCRSRAAGHLFDFVAPTGAAAPEDLTAAARPTPPAATYRPSTYQATGQAPRIVFRGLRGPIWQIQRDTLVATNLTDASGAPTAAGSPSAVAVSGGVHIAYRGTDGTVHEIFSDAAGWRTRVVGTEAAADPTAYEEFGQVAISFRTSSGGIRVARLLGGTWSIEDAR